MTKETKTVIFFRGLLQMIILSLFAPFVLVWGLYKMCILLGRKVDDDFWYKEVY